MVDSSIVLWGQTIAYSFYCIVIILVMGWFALRVTRGKSSVVKPGLFYAFVGFLIVLGVSLHIITYNTIPWAPVDLHHLLWLHEPDGEGGKALSPGAFRACHRL